ncbi:hypothetical protein B0J14DRAFT_674286 [Halenospora varia]|nr:hypothetical protein B0J14DRAFT_674286 [Halenospora varia]
MALTQEQRDEIVDTFEGPSLQESNQPEVIQQSHGASPTRTLSSSTRKKTTAVLDKPEDFLKQGPKQGSSQQAGEANPAHTVEEPGLYKAQRNFAQGIHNVLLSGIEKNNQRSVYLSNNETGTGTKSSQERESETNLPHPDNEETLNSRPIDPNQPQPSPRLTSTQSQHDNEGSSAHQNIQEFVHVRIQQPPPPPEAVTPRFFPLRSEDERDQDALRYEEEQRSELYASRDVSAQPSSNTFFSRQHSETITTTPLSSAREFREEVGDQNTPSQATSSTHLSQHTAEKLAESLQQRPRREAMHERKPSDPLSIFTSPHTGLPQKEIRQRPEVIVRVSGDSWVLVTPTKNLSSSQEKTVGRTFSRFLKVDNEENARRMQNEDIRFPQDDLSMHSSLEEKKIIIQQLLEQRGEEEARREVCIPGTSGAASDLDPPPSATLPDAEPSLREPRILPTEEDRLLGLIWLNGKTRWADFNRRTRELLKRLEILNKIKTVITASGEPAVAPTERGKTEMENNLVAANRTVEHVEGELDQGNAAGEQLDITPAPETPELFEHRESVIPKRETSELPEGARDSMSTTSAHNFATTKVVIKRSWNRSLADQVGKNYRRYFRRISHWGDVTKQQQTELTGLREILEKQHNSLRSLWKKKVWVVIIRTKYGKRSERKIIGSVFINGEIPGFDRARLQNLVIDKRWKDRGLEEKLVKKAIRFAAKKGFDEVYFPMFGPFDDKKGATPPYEHLGFRKESATTHKVPESGRELEETLLLWTKGYDPYGPHRLVERSGNNIAG